MPASCPFDCEWPSIIFLAAFYISKSILLLNAAYSILLSMIIYVFCGGWKFLRLLVLTLPRDLHGLSFLIKMKLLMWRLNRDRWSIYNSFEATAKRKGLTTLGLIFEDQKWTFGQLLELTDRLASVYQKLGIKRDDRIGLLMESHAVYPTLWIAATKFGASTGLLNYSLKEMSLQHSVDELKPRLLITSVILSPNLVGINLPRGCELLTLDDRQISPDNFRDTSRKFSIPEELTSCQSLDRLIAESDGSFVCDPDHRPNVRDNILFIYTSGTTGLPKAAKISFARYLMMSVGPNHFLRLDYKRDLIYNSLPLYHTAGGITGIGQFIIFGIPVAIRRKFSASQFWIDCIKYNATVIQYVGELCRYLLAQPYRSEETAHNVRLAYGNGVRPQVWIDFVHRFKVAQIGEFYGATESNANFVNSENKLGAIGFSSVLVPWAYPVYLIRTDPVTEEIVRDPKTGLCLRCNYGEVGQLVGAIRTDDPLRNFDGYTNSQASHKKVIRNVFKKGDMWFLSGDLLVQDDLGFYYFRDRLGDTFRWRGENVSTNEVEAVIMAGLDLQCCVVYGIEVPNCEGKAGMLAMGINQADHVTETSAKQIQHDVCHNLVKALENCVKNQLPPYAQPLFVRFVDKIDTTGTFKLRKVDLVKAGFDPGANEFDLIYFLNPKTHSYEELTPILFEEIQSGRLCF